jgi:predicted metal-dependent hydrolase
LRAKAKPARRAHTRRKKESRAQGGQPIDSRANDQFIFDHGVALFNGRKFFEAHEAWEEIWLHAKLPEKTFLQGLIQVTAAFHHHSRGNLRGMESLLRRGLHKLNGFPPSHRGLKLGSLRTNLRKWLAALENSEPKSQLPLPSLKAQR